MNTWVPWVVVLGPFSIILVFVLRAYVTPKYKYFDCKGRAWTDKDFRDISNNLDDDYRDGMKEVEAFLERKV